MRIYYYSDMKSISYHVILKIKIAPRIQVQAQQAQKGDLYEDRDKENSEAAAGTAAGADH